MPDLLRPALLFVALVASTAAADERPNILVIIADDLGVANIGAYTAGPDAEPGTAPPTPSIDALGESGVLFREAWSAPVCSPTRAAMFTGRYGLRTGVRTVGDSLPGEEVTWAELLRDVGYLHGLFGKWHLGQTAALGGNDTPRVSGGWDHFEGRLGGSIGGDYFAFTETVNGTTQAVANYATSEVVDDVLAWIATRNEPWTCTVSFNAPHSPFHDPPSDLHSFDLGNGDGNTTRYKAAIEAMDTEIGRLLEGLGSRIDSTVVVFLGDNGTPRQVTEAPYTTAKGDIYQGGIHVPLIVRAPFVDRPGREVSTPVHVTDLFATILAYAGIDPVAALPGVAIDGVSLRLLLEDDTATLPRETIYSELVADDPADGLYAVRDARYKLVEIEGTRELYDLALDPLETNDLIDEGLAPTEQIALGRLLTALDDVRHPCVADLGDDGAVGFGDVTTLLEAWGPCPSPATACPADIDHSGRVGFADLMALVQAWGPCS